MRLLLDTHILLWWLGSDRHLTSTLADLIASGENDVFVSAVTMAEIAIKQSLGKLDAPPELADRVAEGGFTSLPLTAPHALGLADLPWHHHDPFDRMLIAQALAEDLTLATADPALKQYDVKLVH